MLNKTDYMPISNAYLFSKFAQRQCAIMFNISDHREVLIVCGEGVGVISIPHEPQPFTHVPNPQLPTNSFSAMYSFGEIGIDKLRRRPKRIDFVSFNP